MDLVFEAEKKYRLIINRDGYELIFNARDVRIVSQLLIFYDRDNKQMVFPITSLRQANEVKP